MLKRLSTAAFLLVIFTAFCLLTIAEAEQYYVVARVVDGDTIQLTNKQTVRLIGVDTPEVYPSKKLNADVERTGKDKATIQALGKQSSDFVKKMVEGKRVRLEYDQNKTDVYGRTLAFIYLPDNTFVNLEIIKAGYGHAYTKYPFKEDYMTLFRIAETEAREHQRGLWREGLYEN